MKTLIALGGLLLFVLVGSFFFLPFAPAILSSDFAAFHLNTLELLHGHMVFFMLEQSYGGTLAVNLLRLLFLKLAWPMGFGSTPSSELMVLSVFTFVVIPFLLSTAVFYSLKQIVRASSAWIVAASVALGWNYLLRELYSNDYYVSYVIMGLFLLPLRRGAIHPFRDLDRKRLALAALITGYGVYSCRAFMVIAVAFWTPWRLIPAYLSSMRQCPGPIAHLLKGIGTFLLGLSIYLFVFGENLGSIAGHPVKLQSVPNFHLALLCFAALFALAYYRRFHFKVWSQQIVVFLGCIIAGFSPELIHHLLAKGPGIQNPTYTHDFHGMMSILTQLPDALKTLVSANSGRLDSVLFVLLALAAIATLIRFVKSSAEMEGIVASFIFGILAFILIRTYEGPAPVRYLFPILPSLWFGMAILLDKPKSSGRVALAVLIVGALGSLQVLERHSWSKELSADDRREFIATVVDAARTEHVPIVVTDNYLHSNQFSAASRFNPIFVGPQRWIEPSESSTLLNTSCDIGYLSKVSQDSATPISLRDKSYSLRPIRQIGKYRLYSAHRSDCLSEKSP